MNANKLFKLLKRTGGSFGNLESYEKVLANSARVILDFSNFKNFDILVEKAKAKAKTEGLKLAFDNILFDITGLEAPNPITGKSEKQPLMLHVVPVEMATDISTFNIMLVQDLRPYRDNIYPRSHIVFLDEKISCMPAVDVGMPQVGCKCSEKNPLSHRPLFQKIQAFTPGFNADCGFALAECPSTLKPCQQLQQGSKTITDIAIAAMVYASMPGHSILRITEGSEPTNGLKQMPSHVVVDHTNIGDLAKSPLSFQDGNQFDAEMMRMPPLTLKDGPDAVV